MKQRGCYEKRNYIKKIRGNNVQISTIVITSKKNTLKKHIYFDHRNYVKKKYVKTTSEIFHQRNYTEKSK